MSLSWLESWLDSWTKDESECSEEFCGNSVRDRFWPPIGRGVFLGTWGTDTIEDSSREQPSN